MGSCFPGAVKSHWLRFNPFNGGSNAAGWNQWAFPRPPPESRTLQCGRPKSVGLLVFTGGSSLQGFLVVREFVHPQQVWQFRMKLDSFGCSFLAKPYAVACHLWISACETTSVATKYLRYMRQFLCWLKQICERLLLWSLAGSCLSRVSCLTMWLAHPPQKIQHPVGMVRASWN